MMHFLIFAVVVLIVIVAYVLYRHADLRKQAQSLAEAVLDDARTEAKTIAKQISGKA